MKTNKLKGSRTQRLSWHQAFLQAIRLELSEYGDDLEFKYEYQLTTDPLRIDVLIIKKPKRLTVEKNIARIFRAVNIFEYKSPEDSLSIKDFFKVCAYAYLYAANDPETDLSDITINFIGSRYPRTLIKYLTGTRGYKIEKPYPGIYFVSGSFIPIQIIVSKKLPETENLWLKSLTNDLKIRNLNAILEKGKQRKGQMPLGAYFDVIFRANNKVSMEVLTMYAPTLEEMLTEAGVLPKLEARWEARRKAEERQYFLELINQSLSLEELKQRLVVESPNN